VSRPDTAAAEATDTAAHSMEDQDAVDPSPRSPLDAPGAGSELDRQAVVSGLDVEGAEAIENLGSEVLWVIRPLPAPTRRMLGDRVALAC
jgi:hypothetical protein